MLLIARLRSDDHTMPRSATRRASGIGNAYHGFVDEARLECFTGRVTNISRSRGRRSQAESIRTQARILDRAERLFARKGYRGASLRELASAAGVRPFTVQHHFGSKLGLYQAVLNRWDGELLARLSRIAEEGGDLATVVESVMDELFEFFLSKRDWVAVSARAALGEGLPRRVALHEQSWIQFIDSTMRDQRFGALKLDLGLLLITVEGILQHHVLSEGHYRQLYGKDVTDPRLKKRTKQHLKTVILALVESGR
jgi:AcrR family transcriptional regulator